jgi:hypothetical protein
MEKKTDSIDNPNYTITIAIITHGCVLNTDLNDDYNIELYNATGNKMDVCEKTYLDFDNEHIKLLEYYRMDTPIPEEKEYFNKIPYDKKLGKNTYGITDLYAGIWLVSVHNSENKLVFPREKLLDRRFNLLNLEFLNHLFYDFNRDKWFQKQVEFATKEDSDKPCIKIQEYNPIKEDFKVHKLPEKDNEGYRNVAEWNGDVSVNDVENPTHIDKIRFSYLLDRLKYIFGDNVKFRIYDYSCTTPCNDKDDIKIKVPLTRTKTVSKRKKGGKRRKKKTIKKQKSQKKKTIFSR